MLSTVSLFNLLVWYCVIQKDTKRKACFCNSCNHFSQSIVHFHKFVSCYEFLSLWCWGKHTYTCVDLHAHHFWYGNAESNLMIQINVNKPSVFKFISYTQYHRSFQEEGYFGVRLKPRLWKKNKLLKTSNFANYSRMLVYLLNYSLNLCLLWGKYYNTCMTGAFTVT